MVIIDMVNSLKADGFSFNLIMKSVDDNSEPFVMGTMGLEEVNNVIQRELAKLADTQNIGPLHSASAMGSIPAAPATPTSPRPPRTGAPPNDVLRDSFLNFSRSLSDTLPCST